MKLADREYARWHSYFSKLIYKIQISITQAKMQKNIPSVESSFISQPTSEEVSFPIQTTTEIVRTLDESNMESKSLNTPVNESLENNTTDLQDRNSLKNETLDSDFSAVESDEYSDDEGDSDSWDSDNSGTNFGKRSRSSKRPKRCEPGEVYGIATEMNDEIMEKETQQFQAVMNATWTNEVSRNALRTLKEAKRNCPTIVPLPEDILTLQ
ncbi:hypothetical protein Anas_06923, partial [Armadillidium nasatum]